MPRIDLQVPFQEKDAAQRLGARWDPRQRVWYVPANVDPVPLQKWCPRSSAPNMRAPRYFVAAATRDCWRCAALTEVVALVLPAGHETWYVEDDPADDHWRLAEEPTLLSYVEDLAASVAARLRPLAPHYRPDSSQTVQRFYWMNHCEHCSAKLGDFETVDEYGAAFSPLSSAQAAAIYLEEITEPFSASCGGHTEGLEWFGDASTRR